MGKTVIGILGSSLSDGNTAKLLDRALKGAEDAGCNHSRRDPDNCAEKRS